MDSFELERHFFNQCMQAQGNKQQCRDLVQCVLRHHTNGLYGNNKIKVGEQRFADVLCHCRDLYSIGKPLDLVGYPGTKGESPTKNPGSIGRGGFSL